jgi:hypothetical protein
VYQAFNLAFVPHAADPDVLKIFDLRESLSDRRGREGPREVPGPRRIWMRSTTKTRFEKRLVDTARENLEAMPPPPAETKLLSMREAIQELAPTITKLLRRGHTRASVVALLREQGIECSPASFRSIYRSPKPRARDAKVTASKTAAPPASATGATGPTLAAPQVPSARSNGSVVAGAGRGDGRGVGPVPTQAPVKAS